MKKSVKKKKQTSQNPVIVTGLSGAGISTVLKIFEDMGLEVFDNFPLSLVPALLRDTKPGSRIAIGIDTRTRGFKPQTILEQAKKSKAHLLFIACDETVLQKRFTETRRRHPMAKGRPVKTGIAEERKSLSALQKAADLTIDTSELSVHDVRHILRGHFDRRKKPRLNIALMSFGFRYGAPREADIVMDIRFLKNPHWVPALKSKTGLDAKVGDYIKTDKTLTVFLENFKKMLKPLLPLYAEEGKNYLTIALGCTGGRHRSVYLVGEIDAWLKEMGYATTLEHRDLKK
ncbi:MAG: RNase adapter RapZ [Alphaproteobacteria bacterium]